MSPVGSWLRTPDARNGLEPGGWSLEPAYGSTPLIRIWNGGLLTIPSTSVEKR
jgi:hypothetical protein